MQTAAGVSLAVVLLALFFRGTDVEAIRGSLLGARPAWIGLAVALMLFTYALRALRWQILLAPIGTAGWWNCFVATVIGFSVNFLVPPGRLGEIARPYVLARKEGFSASSALRTRTGLR